MTFYYIHKKDIRKISCSKISCLYKETLCNLIKDPDYWSEGFQINVYDINSNNYYDCLPDKSQKQFNTIISEITNNNCCIKYIILPSNLAKNFSCFIHTIGQKYDCDKNPLNLKNHLNDQQKIEHTMKIFSWNDNPEFWLALNLNEINEQPNAFRLLAKVCN